MARAGRRKRKQGGRADRELRTETIRPWRNLRTAADHRHADCYARAAGYCSTKLSAEHFLSSVMLETLMVDYRGLFIRGVPWADGGRWVRPETLTAKVLCDAHNNAMSPLDGFGGLFFNEYRRIHADLLRDSAVSTVIRFNGFNLERLMLKMLCGLLASGNAAIRGQVLPRDVPEQWLSVLLGHADFAGTAGLYVSGRVREQVQTRTDQISFGPVFLGERVAGVHMGLPLFQATLITRPVPQNAEGLIHQHSVYRPSTLRWTDGRAEHNVSLDWGRVGPGERVTMMYEKVVPASR
jgi:hypothetical protein